MKKILMMLLCIYCSALYSQNQTKKYFTYIDYSSFFKVIPNFETNPFDPSNNKVQALIDYVRYEDRIEWMNEAARTPLEGLFTTERIKEVLAADKLPSIYLFVDNQGKTHYIYFIVRKENNVLTDDELYTIYLAYKKKFVIDMKNIKVQYTSKGYKDKYFDFYKEGFSFRATAPK